MLSNKYHIRRAIWLIVLTSTSLLAGNNQVYLGLTIGDDKKTIKETLQKRNASFADNYGYKGYGKELPIIKVERDPLMSKHGQVKEGWLHFTPDGKLYMISVTWRDAGETYAIIKDVMDQKYGRGNVIVNGFKKTHTYSNGPVEIALHRNNFGFGNAQTTKLSYTHTPSLPSVRKMEVRIDEHIRQKRLKESGSNL